MTITAIRDEGLITEREVRYRVDFTRGVCFPETLGEEPVPLDELVGPFNVREEVR